MQGVLPRLKPHFIHLREEFLKLDHICDYFGGLRSEGTNEVP